MAPLRRHRTSPRVIGREQADAEGLPLIHLGVLGGAARPWAVAGSVDRGRASGLALTRSTRGRHGVGLWRMGRCWSRSLG